MSKLSTILGYVWASPITLLGFSYASLFKLAGWYSWHGKEGDALVWLVKQEKSPDWLLSLWKGWGGHAIGNVVVLKESPSANPLTLKHEQKHVDQVMRLGIFQPLAYFISSLALKIGCPGSDPYYSNPFEIDARRHAGQVIDVEGHVKKLKAKLAKEV